MIREPTREERAEAARFVATFAGHWYAPQFWQVFDDQKAKNVYPRNMVGSLRAIGWDLVRVNMAGGGVFLTINETDGERRKGENIRKIRALWVDCDKVDPSSWHLPPSMVVRSVHGPHVYWLVDDCPVDDFTDCQKRLIALYGSDPVIHDRNRVMRVPGFWHNKADPVMVWIEQCSGARYTTAQVLAGVPELQQEPKPVTRMRREDYKLPAGHWRTIDALHAFEMAGLYGRPLGGGKHAVCCPWVNEHSQADPTGMTGDTVIFEGDSTRAAVFYCAHSHCQGRYMSHALREIGSWC